MLTTIADAMDVEGPFSVKLSMENEAQLAADLAMSPDS